ncbi:NifU family protein [Amycolatopsis stemonae]
MTPDLETLLGALLAGENRGRTEEIVRLLTDLHGEGLARVVALLRADDPALVEAIAADERVSGPLTLHDLHPLDVPARVRRALAEMGGEAGYLGTDGAVVRVWHTGGCAARATVEARIRDAAPEIEGVEFVTALHQIGMGPPAGRAS